MAKVQIQTEIEIHKLLTQLKTSQLEAFLREISALIRRRKAKDKKVLEARLLQRLNEECVLPTQDWQDFLHLKDKREAENINDVELTRLTELIKSEEKLRLKRINILGELAEIRGVSLPQLIKELGIFPQNSA